MYRFCGLVWYDVVVKKPKIQYLIGVDEVGRGPLAGPVAVGAVCINTKHQKILEKWGRGFRDSKKLSARAREAWMVKIKKAQEDGLLEYSVAFVSSLTIDKKGIAPSICTALARSLKPFELTKVGALSARVLLDGGLRAPLVYENQKTIIKGDEKELVIALASIVAKVTRDAWMVKLGKKFPAYGFEKHKGYGTRTHYLAIEKHGITAHHRKSFLKKKGKKK
jgi:ribonuclease HII